MPNPTPPRPNRARARIWPIGLLLISLPIAAGELWDRVKAGTARTIESGGDLISNGVEKAQSLTEQGIEKGSELTGKGVEIGSEAIEGGVDYGKRFADDTLSHFNREGSPEEVRAEVDQMTIDTLDRLFSDYPESQLILESGYGYAIFDVRQVSLTVTGGYGYGVAISNDGSRRVYMKMVTGGLGLSAGIGGFASKLVILFSTPEAFTTFVEIGLDAGAEASGMAGKERADLGTYAQQDTTIYRITDGGLKVAATLTGTRFWPDEALNQAVPAEQ